MIDITQILATILIIAVPLFMGIIFHEVSHGYVAYRLGDPTARNAGRLSLNPVRHIDPLGTVIFPGILILLKSPFLFGWAKPVPINPSYFEEPRKGIFLVSLAGPVSNFVLAAACYLLFIMLQPAQGGAVFTFIWFGIYINILLGVFNLFPVPPLDGSKLIAVFLPGRLAGQYMQMEKYGFIILILLIISGLMGWLFTYIRYFTHYLLT